MKNGLFDRTTPFNDLPFLPPSKDKVQTVEILNALNRASRALAELKGFAKKLPNQAVLVNTIALREAKASTAIENIITTDDALYQALSVSDSNLDSNAKEVLRYRQALWEGFAHVKKEGSISLEIILNLYRQIKQLNDGIRPAQAETVIKKYGTGPLGGTVMYTPPRGEKIIESKLENLLQYINDDDQFKDDPLIKIAISHYQFEAIHPFRDGNGRTGRILNTLIMIQKELLDEPILYLSAFIIENKKEYYELLNKVTTLGSWNDWILYMLRAIEETSLFTISKINEIDRLFIKTTELINKNFPKVRKETIEKIFEQPYVRPKKIIDSNIKSLNTAKKLLEDLRRLKVMSPKKIGKEIVYLNIDLFDLLSET